MAAQWVILFQVVLPCWQCLQEHKGLQGSYRMSCLLIPKGPFGSGLEGCALPGLETEVASHEALFINTEHTSEGMLPIPTCSRLSEQPQ